MRELEVFILIFCKIAVECLRVLGYVLLIFGFMFLLFGVEPGRGYAWPV